MERRAEDRTKVSGNPEVWVEVLGQGNGLRVRGRLIDLSGVGSRMQCETPIRPGSAVKIQWDDELWLAETIHLQAAEGHWFIGLKIRQRLTRLAELRKLMAGLVGSPSSEREAQGSQVFAVPTRGASGRPLAGVQV